MIFDHLLAKRDIANRELRFHLIIGRSGDRNAARFRERLYPVGNIDAVAVNILALDDDVPEIDTNAKNQTLFPWSSSIALSLFALHLDRTTQCGDHALELDQQAVTHGLDQPSIILGDLWLEDLVQVILKTGARSLLVDLAQMAVTDDISNQNGCKTALHAPGPLSAIPAVFRPELRKNKEHDGSCHIL